MKNNDEQQTTQVVSNPNDVPEYMSAFEWRAIWEEIRYRDEY
jgi:hypothetical protein